MMLKGCQPTSGTRTLSTSSSGRLLKGSNLARAPQMQPIMQAGHLIVACQRVGLLLPLSLGTDILEPCNRSDALGAISSDSEQDEYEVGLHHLEYTDNCIQQYFDHTHPDAADELFLSSDVLSPSFKADHEAQSPAGFPCPPGNVVRKAKPVAAWDPYDTGDQSDLVAETSLNLKRASSLPEPGHGEEAASRLNELPSGEKIHVGDWLSVASPSTTSSLHLVEDRHKTECRESLCTTGQAQCLQCFTDREPTRPSSGRRFQAHGIKCGEGCGNYLCDRCRERATRRRRIEGLTRAACCYTCHPSFHAVQQECARLLVQGFGGLVPATSASRRYEVLMTRTLEGPNAMSCSYNCVEDKFSILRGTVVLWSGRWKDKCVCQSSDHVNCIIRPQSVFPATSRVQAARAHHGSFGQVNSVKKYRESRDVFVGFSLKRWNEFERQIALLKSKIHMLLSKKENSQQPVATDHLGLTYINDNASDVRLINKRGFLPAKRVNGPATVGRNGLTPSRYYNRTFILEADIGHKGLGDTDARWVESYTEASKNTTFFLPSVVTPKVFLPSVTPSAFAATATRASTSREGWAREREREREREKRGG